MLMLMRRVLRSMPERKAGRFSMRRSLDPNLACAEGWGMRSHLFNSNQILFATGNNLDQVACGLRFVEESGEDMHLEPEDASFIPAMT